jgi:hypothetical protein
LCNNDNVYASSIDQLQTKSEQRPKQHLFTMNKIAIMIIN